MCNNVEQAVTQAAENNRSTEIVQKQVVLKCQAVPAQLVVLPLQPLVDQWQEDMKEKK